MVAIADSSRYDANVFFFITGASKTYSGGLAYQGPCFVLTNEMGSVCSATTSAHPVVLEFLPTDPNAERPQVPCENGIVCTGKVFFFRFKSF